MPPLSKTMIAIEDKANYLLPKLPPSTSMKYFLQPATSEFSIETTDLRFCINERSALTLIVDIVKYKYINFISSKA